MVDLGSSIDVSNVVTYASASAEKSQLLKNYVIRVGDSLD